MHTAEWRVRVWRIWSSVTYYMFLPCLNSHHFATEFYLLASLYMTVRVASHHHIPKPNLDCRAPTQGELWLAEKLEWRRSWLAPGIPTQSVHFSGHLKGLSPIYKYIGVIRCTSRVFPFFWCQTCPQTLCIQGTELLQSPETSRSFDKMWTITRGYPRIEFPR